MHRATHSLNPFLRALGIALIAGPVVVADQRPDPQMSRAPDALTIEAESLLGSAQTSHGQVVVQNMQGFGAGWSGGAQLFWGGAPSGAQLRLSFPTRVTGRYDVLLHFTRAPDFAVVRAQLDDDAPVNIDGYAPAVGRARVLLATRDLTPGGHALHVQVTGRDPKSAGFNVGLDRIELKRVVDQPTFRNPAAGGGETAAAPGGNIPVLNVPRGSFLQDDSPLQPSIPSLPMSARVEIVQKALSSTSTPSGQPDMPIRLSAAFPRNNLSGLFVMNGQVDAQSDRISLLISDAALHLYFDPLEPHRPHLLECACFIGWDNKPIPIRVSTPIKGQKVADISDLKYMDLSVITLTGQGVQRLLSVVMPSESHLLLRLAPKPGYGLVVNHCELTPFK